MTIITYKILTIPEFFNFKEDGYFEGNESDKRDGFFHMCASEEQLPRIINKYFKDKSIVILRLKFEEDEIKNEEAQGEIYPHYYGEKIEYSRILID